MTTVSITGLHRRFSPQFGIEGLDLELGEGEFVTLLGPSGSGKTTTLRILAGLEKPDSGKVVVGGRVMNDAGVFVPPHRRRMGMVFQSYAVWPHRTVYENVAFPLKVQGVSRDEERKRVAEMLDLVELQSGTFAERYANQLSGGQQQRVSLARALVARPDVVLYDEPLSNLDARLRDVMRTLIRDIHNRIKTTSLYVTHDQSEAMVLSDRVCIMDRGRIVRQDTPRGLHARPDSRFVTEFLGGANILRVETHDKASGELRLASGAVMRATQWPEGTPEHFVIRHHHVALLPQGMQAENVLDVVVRSSEFLGDRVRLTLESEGGLVLVASMVPPQVEIMPGAALRVVLPVEHCLVI